MEREPRADGPGTAGSGQGQVQRVDGGLQDPLTERTPAVLDVGPERVSRADSWVARVSDRLLDDAAPRTHDGGRSSRGPRPYGGASLWGGVVIVVVKIAFAAALFLMLASSLQ